MKQTRVVVTGLGAVTSIGINKDTFWRNLLKGKSGISKISTFNVSNFRTFRGGEVKKPIKGKQLGNRSSEFLLKALSEARTDSGLSKAKYKKSEIGLTVGSFQMDHLKIENMHGWKRNSIYKKSRTKKDTVDAFFPLNKSIFQNCFSSALNFLSITGPAMNVTTVCSAGNYAICFGYDMIIKNRAKAVYCAGADTISRFLHAGFNRLLISSPDKCSPFDKNRKGMLVGEGAGVLVLETLENALKRKAPIYAEILGYGLSCDAFSMTMPSFKGMHMVIKNALKSANIKKEQVDYINAHGTGTLNNDNIEAQAINKVFGKHAKTIDVTSIKSMLGHPMSASSAIEAVSCCLSMRNNIIPPTINYKTKDPQCDIQVVANKAKKRKLNIILNNSFAFGGNNASVVFSKYKK